jgi:integrase
MHDFLTAADIATRLKISAKQARRLMATMPTVAVGATHRRVDPADFERWITEQKKGTTTWQRNGAARHSPSRTATSPRIATASPTPPIGGTTSRSGESATAVVEQRKTEMRQRQRGEVAPAAPIAAPVAVATAGRKQITLDEAIAKYEREVAVNFESFKQCQTFGEWLLNVAEKPDTLLSDITHDDVAQYYLRRTSTITRRKRTLSRSSVNREIAYLRQVYRHCKRAGFDVGQEPVWGKIMDHSAEAERIRELKPDEEARLFEAIQRVIPDLLPVVEFALLSGLRKTAVIQLDWQRVDFVNREARVFLKSKGFKKKEHIIPLTDRMVAIIRAQPRVEGCDKVFTYRCQRGGRKAANVHRLAGARYPFTSTGWMAKWRRAVKEAKIEDFRFHDLRHSAATRIVRQTGNIALAQRLLGHSNITTTSRYAHSFTNDVRAAMEQAEKARDANLEALEREDGRNVVPLKRA